MKKIKKVLFCLIILILSGCTANYDINITDDKVFEKLELMESDPAKFDVDNGTGWTLRDSFSSIITSDEFSKETYTTKSLNTDTQLGTEYSSSFDLMELSNSPIINQCYSNSYIEYDNENITITTGDEFNCYNYYEYLDKVVVRLKTNHSVIESNADSINKNTYEWNITKDGNKNIHIILSRDYTKNSNKIIFYSSIILIVLIFAAIVYLVFKRNQKENKI